MSKFDSNYNSVVSEVETIISSHLHPFDGFDTIAVHGGYEPTEFADMGRPVITPISLSTTFQQLEAGKCKYDYSRGGNVTRDALEKCIAALENGSECCTYASGLAAFGAVLQTLPAGSHILAYEDLYGGTGRYIRTIGANAGLTHTLVDATNHEKFRAGFNSNTRLVLIESPSNPTMNILDLEELIKITRAYATENSQDIIVMVDNTFMSPFFQRPLNFGADVVLHSLTKYMNGHSDVVMGALITTDAASRSKDLASKLRFNQFAGGAVPSAFDCYLCLRGIRTLGVRMRTHMRNGLIVGKMLEQHPEIEKVLHPGLPSHPQHKLALKQMQGFCGMLSIYVKGSSERAQRFVAATKIFALAESLGGFESLIEIPSIMTHASVPPEIRAQNGITDNLIRLSIGLEDPKELVKALYTALDATVSTINGGGH